MYFTVELLVCLHLEKSHVYNKYVNTYRKEYKQLKLKNLQLQRSLILDVM
jgi:hypothetical protein